MVSGVPTVAQWLMNRLGTMRLWFDPWPRSVGRGSGVAKSWGAGCRCGSDPTLLWLWRRPEAAAPMRPLAWEPPYATGAALEKAKRPKKKKKKIIHGTRKRWQSRLYSGGGMLLKWICIRAERQGSTLSETRKSGHA